MTYYMKIAEQCLVLRKGFINFSYHYICIILTIEL